MAPEGLYGAAVTEVGVLDMLKACLILDLIIWFNESLVWPIYDR